MASSAGIAVEATAPQQPVPPIDIKLFVGRLPTTATEESLRPLFEEFGGVIEVVIIRDKASGAHKGSAFVRMASIREADAAIRALSNIRVLDPSLGPVQISYAVGEPERLGFSPGALNPNQDEAKLFIGSLPRDVTETDVTEFFSSHGKCHDPYLMRDPATKRFKGCGFIKFEQKEDALRAIRMLHGKVTFPKASRPLELRIAEPKRSTNPGGRGPPAGAAGSGWTGGGNRSTAAAATRTTVAPRTGGLVSLQQTPGGGGTLASTQNVAVAGGTSFATTATGPQPTIPQLNAHPRTVGPWKEYFTADGRPYYHNCHTLLTQWDVPTEFAQAFAPQNHLEGDPTGPPGANVFVFHVPSDWGKEDLMVHFAPFGHIVSAMVATDHSTQRNRGYGFVSYSSIHSALQAVQGMNMLPVGNKRLRVAIKNGEREHARHFAEQHGLPFPSSPPMTAKPDKHNAATPVTGPAVMLGQPVASGGQPASSGGVQQHHASPSYGPPQQQLPPSTGGTTPSPMLGGLQPQQQQSYIMSAPPQDASRPMDLNAFSYGNTYPFPMIAYGQGDSDRVTGQLREHHHQQQQPPQQRFGP